jgi:hypothetical protein
MLGRDDLCFSLPVIVWPFSGTDHHTNNLLPLARGEAIATDEGKEGI